MLSKINNYIKELYNVDADEAWNIYCDAMKENRVWEQIEDAALKNQKSLDIDIFLPPLPSRVIKFTIKASTDG